MDSQRMKKNLLMTRESNHKEMTGESGKETKSRKSLGHLHVRAGEMTM